MKHKFYTKGAWFGEGRAGRKARRIVETKLRRASKRAMKHAVVEF